MIISITFVIVMDSVLISPPHFQLAESTNHPFWYTKRSEVYFKIGDLQKAYQDATRALEQQPSAEVSGINAQITSWSKCNKLFEHFMWVQLEWSGNNPFFRLAFGKAVHS
jgi:hypothetical protein